MLRTRFLTFIFSGITLFTLSIALLSLSLAQEWAVKGPSGTLKVVDMYVPSVSTMLNYAEGLVTTDKDNNVIPCLAKNWRWVDERTIEFKLRKGVRFHNGQEFNAETVKMNWEAYREMENPRVISFTNLPDETELETIDKYMVRFTLPSPDALALVKFGWFFQVAPEFFKKHQVPEKSWVYLPEAGPWGTGPFEFVEGSQPYGVPSDRLVLEAYEDYWHPDYPKVRRVIFENTLLADRKKAMSLCGDSEGQVDIVSYVRPLDTLKIAESHFAKVVKSKDVTSLGCMINQRKKDSKWRDIRLRKALNYAINRKELLKYCAKGNARNLCGFVPRGAYGHNLDLSLYSFDTAGAKALLSEAGYPKGFEVKIIANEGWRLEAQIVGKMLQRVGLKVKLDVYSMPELLKKIYMPHLDKPPEEQDWDLCMAYFFDRYAHTAASMLAFWFLEESDYRWIEYDPVYENMWKDIVKTVEGGEQERKIRQAVQYLYDNAYCLFLYSPLTLYAVNKEVKFVPQSSGWLRLKETSVTDQHWSMRGKDN